MVTEKELFESTNKKVVNCNKEKILFNTKINFTFNSTFMFQRQICYTEMINLLCFTINVRKSHRHPQCTLQLLCEVRVLESAFAFLYAGSGIKMRTSSSFRVSTLLSHNSLLIQHH